MRLPLMSPSALNSEQRRLYDDMRKGIETNFKGFTAIDVSGRLIGPWNPWLRFAKFGGPVWELVQLAETAAPVREIAILVTGAHFHSAYEIYAYVLVAELRGIGDDKIATIIAGQRPGDLTRQEAVAYDLAYALVSGGVLPAPDLSASHRAIRRGGDGGVHLSRRPLLHGVGDAQRLRRAGARNRRDITRVTPRVRASVGWASRR
jgi:4-carboxymuconolactone decarboxylase